MRDDREELREGCTLSTATVVVVVVWCVGGLAVQNGGTTTTAAKFNSSRSIIVGPTALLST